MPKRPAFVYRAYDAENRLLYVGCAYRWKLRKSAHSKKFWHRDAVRWEAEEFPCRSEADVAERVAIETEHPLHNVFGRTKKHPTHDGKLTAYARFDET